MAQDDYYYEIQLTNKQLVFYFVAGAMGLILSFLAGVMVGRGVDANAGEVQAAQGVQTIQEDRVVPEEPASRPASPPPAEDLTYARRLVEEKADDTLRSVPATPGPAADTRSLQRKAAEKRPPTPAPTPKAVAPPRPAATPTPAPRATPKPVVPDSRPAAGAYTVQVGAFKDRAAAESVVSGLKGKGYAAYLASPEESSLGLFNVRVGSFAGRADAERVLTKLRDEEKFKPFIVQQ